MIGQCTERRRPAGSGCSTCESQHESLNSHGEVRVNIGHTVGWVANVSSGGGHRSSSHTSRQAAENAPRGPSHNEATGAALRGTPQVNAVPYTGGQIGTLRDISNESQCG